MLRQRIAAPRTYAGHSRTILHPIAASKVSLGPIGAVDVTRSKKLDRDEGKEQARRYRRTTFDSDQWAAHRSTNRYLRHVKGILSSRIVRGLSGPLTYVGVISLGVCAYETALTCAALPDWGFTWPRLAVEIAGPFSLSTFALSLLLVFRTNSSYQRWNEARKLWGALINRSRDLARQTQQWVAPAEAELAHTLCRWIVAFSLTLMASLREDVELQRELQEVLLSDEVQLVLQQQHPGSAVLQALGQCVALSGAKDIEKLRMDESIALLQDVMGGCERIFRTPIPLTYTRHLTRFLVVWLTALPFCVAHTMGWATVPVTIAMAFFLFGIEEIGVQIEEPFGILAVEGFCAAIASDVAQAQTAAEAMRQTAMAHGATAGSRQPASTQQSLVAATAGSGSSGKAERVSGGYTLPRSPAAVSNVLVEDGIFADKALGWGATGDDSDSVC